MGLGSGVYCFEFRGGLGFGLRTEDLGLRVAVMFGGPWVLIAYLGRYLLYSRSRHSQTWCYLGPDWNCMQADSSHRPPGRVELHPNRVLA